MNYEPVCFYLLEMVKPGGMGRVTQATTAGHAHRVAEVLAELEFQQGRACIRAKLKKAATTGSRIEGGKMLHTSNGR